MKFQSKLAATALSFVTSFSVGKVWEAVASPPPEEESVATTRVKSDKLTTVFDEVLTYIENNAVVPLDTGKAGMDAVEKLTNQINKELPSWQPTDLPHPDDPVKAFANIRRQALEAGMPDEELDRYSNDAIRAMVKSMDPHAAYTLPGPGGRWFRNRLDDKYSGIGIDIDKRYGQPPTVMSVSVAGPAAHAGIEPGDLITHINDKAISDLARSEIRKQLEGKPNTGITVTIERDGQARTYQLERAQVTKSPVTSRMIGDIGYIHLSLVTQRSATDIAQAIEKLNAEPGGKVSGYILDLRGNPGGYIHTGVEIADHFLEDGVILNFKSRTSKREWNADPGDLTNGKPVVLLVDGNTWSSSEIIAAALQDYDRAVIIGTQTYGKGTAQSFKSLPNGGTLRFTTHFSLTPKGRSIQKRGITPDIRYIPPKDQPMPTPRKEADYPNAFENPGIVPDLTESFGTCTAPDGVSVGDVEPAYQYNDAQPDFLLACGVDYFKDIPLVKTKYQRQLPKPLAPTFVAP